MPPPDVEILPAAADIIVSPDVTASSHNLNSLQDNHAGLERSEVADNAMYWWLTSGQDLSRMLIEADYPEECRRQFLNFYRDTICPLLGGRPKPESMPTAVGWDGNPFEYSFEFKESSEKIGVRFVLDLTEVRPARKDKFLDTTTVEKVLDVLRQKSPMYDETWVCFDMTQTPTIGQTNSL